MCLRIADFSAIIQLCQQEPGSPTSSPLRASTRTRSIAPTCCAAATARTAGNFWAFAGGTCVVPNRCRGEPGTRLVSCRCARQPPDAVPLSVIARDWVAPVGGRFQTRPYVRNLQGRLLNHHLHPPIPRAPVVTVVAGYRRHVGHAHRLQARFVDTLSAQRVRNRLGAAL